MRRLRAYWRALWHLCPACNLDAPAIDNCTVCFGWRGDFPPPDYIVCSWLKRYFEPEFARYCAEKEKEESE